MKYFYRKSISDAQAHEITRAEALSLIGATYGSTEILENMEQHRGTNASVFANDGPGQVFIEHRETPE